MSDEVSSSDPILEGVTFHVSYLGSCLVDKPTGDETTANAVKTIVKMVKKTLYRLINLFVDYNSGQDTEQEAEPGSFDNIIAGNKDGGHGYQRSTLGLLYLQVSYSIYSTFYPQYIAQDILLLSRPNPAPSVQLYCYKQ